MGGDLDESKKADKALAKCEGSVLAIFEGIRAICYLYLALDEPRSAWEVVADLMGRLSAVKLEAAKDKARMLRVSPGGSWPEQFWVQAIDAINMSCEQAIEFVATTKTSEENLPLTIELLPEEVAQIGAQPAPSVYSRPTAKEASPRRDLRPAATSRPILICIEHPAGNAVRYRRRHHRRLRRNSRCFHRIPPSPRRSGLPRMAGARQG